MAGVVAALKAHHPLRVIGQPVDDLALALVAPLAADYDYVPCHENSTFRFAGTLAAL
jgi:hypothetical protein